MAFNDIYRLRIYARLHGGQVVNVMHFVEDIPINGTGAQALANDFATNMKTALQGRAVNQMTFDYVEVQSIVPFSGAPAVANFSTPLLGTVGGSTASGTLAEVITIYTSRAGRRGRGRIYLAGGNTDLNPPVSGVWHSQQTIRTQTLATALATRYMQVPYVTSWALGVWSKAIAGPTPPWPTDAFVRANALSVRTIIRNQRRRQVGVGR
jgi:hypothetical protein